MTPSPETITAIGGVLAALAGAAISFLLGKRTAKKSEFETFNAASSAFREELRGDMRKLKEEQVEDRRELSQMRSELSRATARIEALELIIREKDRTIEALLKAQQR